MFVLHFNCFHVIYYSIYALFTIYCNLVTFLAFRVKFSVGSILIVVFSWHTIGENCNTSDKVNEK